MDHNDYDNDQEMEDNTLDKQEQQTDTSAGIAQTARQSAKSKQEKPKQKAGAKTLMSGIVGGVISAVIVALLFTTNVIPLNQQENNNTASSESNDQSAPEIAETVASDSSNIASNMDEASKAVVGVINKQQQNVWTQSQKAGSGSGIIYKKEDGKAYIVTNQHVVEDANEVEVVLNSDQRIQAKVLGTDSFTDLAVLQIDGKKVSTVADLGSSKNIKVGDTVIAIGNPLGMNFANSVTKGIISGLNRSVSIDTNGDRQPDWITEVIQTDAAINPGNSGGALINSKGKVVGINSMKIKKTSVEGIGFAIPIDEAQPIMKQLEKDGEVARPFIGISTASLGQVPPQYRDQIKLPEEVEGGMVVAKVQQGSPASNAELQQFDVITKINGNKIKSILDLRKYLYNETKIGESVKLEIYRNGEPQTIELELVKREQ